MFYLLPLKDETAAGHIKAISNAMKQDQWIFSLNCNIFGSTSIMLGKENELAKHLQEICNNIFDEKFDFEFSCG